MATKKKAKSILKAPPKRKAVLFVRIQEANKEWLKDAADESGFVDVTTFLDALLTENRENWKS